MSNMINDRLRKKFSDLYEESNGNLKSFFKSLDNLACEEKVDIKFILTDLGNHTFKHNYELALLVFDKLITLYSEQKDKLGQADCYVKIAYIYMSIREYEKALDTFNKTLQMYIDTSSNRGVASALGEIGNLYSHMGDFSISLKFYLKAVEIYKQVDDLHSITMTYLNISIILKKHAFFSLSLSYCEKAKLLANKIKNQYLYDLCEKQIASLSTLLEKFNKTFSGDEDIHFFMYNEDASIYKTPIWVNNSMILKKQAMSVPLYDIDELSYYGINELYFIKKASSIFNEIKYYQGITLCLFRLARFMYSIGDYNNSIAYYMEALTNFKKYENNLYGELAICESLGFIYIYTGKYRNAIEYNEMAANLNLNINNTNGAVECFMNVGLSYYHLMAYKQAIKYYNMCLSYTNNQILREKIYVNLGNIYSNILEDINTAKKYYEMSLEISKSNLRPLQIARCYSNLANVEEKQGNFDKAIELNNSALSIGGIFTSELIPLKCYFNIGSIYLQKKSYDLALENYNLALDLATRIDHFEMIININYFMGKVYIELENLESAYGYYKNSLSYFEKFDELIIEEEFKLNYISEVNSIYKEMVVICITLNKYEEAFYYLEKSKSQTLMEMLGHTNINPSVEINDKLKILLDNEKRYLSRLKEIKLRYINNDIVNIKLGEIEEISSNLNTIYQEIEKVDANYVFLRKKKVLSSKEIQQLISLQSEQTVLAEYFLTDTNLYIFIITSRDKKLNVEKIPINIDVINSLINNYSMEVIDYDKEYISTNKWIELSDYLIAPLKKYSYREDTLYIIPYENLHYIPFHALKIEDEYLINRNAIIYNPCASILKFININNDNNYSSLVSFGLALNKKQRQSLNSSKNCIDEFNLSEQVFVDEATEVAKLFNGECLVSENVTKKNVLEEWKDKDIIHFSCHGEFNFTDPLSSSLILYDEKLTYREIFKQRINAKLVTLSACKTGVNEIRLGDELIGLSRAFFYAGASSIVVSLWSVDCISTKELMFVFYQNIKCGKNKAKALQEAQNYIMKKYNHPYYWAPFILVGTL